MASKKQALHRSALVIFGAVSALATGSSEAAAIIGDGGYGGGYGEGNGWYPASYSDAGWGNASDNASCTPENSGGSGDGGAYYNGDFVPTESATSSYAGTYEAPSDVSVGSSISPDMPTTYNSYGGGDFGGVPGIGYGGSNFGGMTGLDYGRYDFGAAAGLGYGGSNFGGMAGLDYTPESSLSRKIASVSFGRANRFNPFVFVGDPINALVGNMVESATDFSGSGPFPIQFTRTYNSLPLKIPGFINSLGSNWRGTYDTNIVVVGRDVYVYRASGTAAKFSLANGAYQSSNSDVVSTLQAVQVNGQPAGWNYTTTSHTVETYDVNGRLIAIIDRNGLRQTLAYDNNGHLTSVTDPAGRSLLFSYDGMSRLATLTGFDGASVQYGYDGHNNLTSITYPDGTTRRYRYENNTFRTLLTGKVDGQGVTVATWTYDNRGRAIGNQMAGGVAAVTVKYKQNSTDVTDALGVTRTRNFQRIGSDKKILSMTVACGDCESNLMRTATYDANGFVTSMTDFGGHQVQYTRDARGLVLTETQAAGTPLARTTRYTWHPVFRVPVEIVLPNHRTSQYVYDGQGNLTKYTLSADGLSKVWTYQYNDAGQVLRAQGPRTDVADVTTFTYDAQGNLASVTNALHQTIRFTQYDANGRLLSMVDPNGLTTTYVYDANGRPTSTTTGALTTRYAYDADGQRTSVVMANGASYAYTYDAAHRLTDVMDAVGNKLHLARDLGGRITQRTVMDSHGATVRNLGLAFDARGRLTQQAGNNGQNVRYTYDRDDNVLTVSDAQSRSAQTQYDALLRVAQSIDPQGGITRYGYDANDLLTSVTSPRGVTTRYQRNGFGQLTSVVSPDTGTARYQYDSAGNLIAATNAKGQTTHLQWDALNRPVTISYADQRKVSMIYDQGTNAIGRLSVIQDQASGNAYQYDALGRVTLVHQHAGTAAAEQHYGYTPIGQLASMHYPSGALIQYGYTSDGKVESMVVGGVTLVDHLQYQADGKIAQWSWGNGHTTTRTFDLDGRLNQYSKANSTGRLTYDTVNRIINLSDSSGPLLTQHFGYDNNDRLTSYNAYATTQSTQYDADGNRTAQLNGVVTQYLYASNSNRLLQLTGGLRAQLEYDATGNIVADGNNRYSYDARGYLARVSNTSGTTRYVINPLGQRVAKFVARKGEHDDGARDDDNERNCDGEDRDQRRQPHNGLGRDNRDPQRACEEHSGDATYFSYDPAGHLIGEYNRDRGHSTEYLWMGNVPVAILKKHGRAPATLYYIHTDHLGTPRQVTDSITNAVVWEWFGEPFGTSLPDEDPGRTGKKFTLNLRYAGQYFDKESHLFHNGFRDFHPQIGRYIESDPIGLAGGINTYSYVEGNPVSYIDPDGLDVMDLIANRAAGIPEGRAQGTISQTVGVDISVRGGFGPAISIKYNSINGLSYIGAGVGEGFSCTITGAGAQLTTGSGAKGLAVEASGSLGNGVIGITGSGALGTDGSTSSVKPGIGTIGASATGTIGWRW